MSHVALPGLVAENPLAFLAALGALSLVDDVRPGARLSWVEDGGRWCACVAGDDLEGTADVAEAIAAACRERRLDAELAWSSDVVLGGRAAARTAIGEGLANGNPEVVAWLRAACVAELPLSINDRPPYTPFRLIPHVGRARFLDTALRDSTDVSTRDLEVVLRGPWVYRKGINTMRLDAASRLQERALMAEAPTHAGSLGVPGALLLAVRGLSFFPLQTTRHAALCSGWSDRSGFTWPIWDEPLTAVVIRMLLSAPWSARDELAARAHHIVARFRADRVVMRDGASFTWGQPVV